MGDSLSYLDNLLVKYKVEQEKRNFISKAAMYYFVLYIDILMTTFLTICEDFRTLSEDFRSFCKSFPNVRQTFPNISEEEPMTFRSYSNASKQFLSDHVAITMVIIEMRNTGELNNAKTLKFFYVNSRI